MLDNEQRAHDIATAMLPTMFQQQVSKIATGKTDKISVDIMEIYNTLYTLALKSLNESN